ncbi:MAG: hypothetical protein ACL9RN_04380 [Cylindrospermopsis raciborskii]|uniref:hypothetical protein n=1 Tax=Cylindrospermopsis raciborskii TaxID=77022 RepID=UPI003D13E3CA
MRHFLTPINSFILIQTGTLNSSVRDNLVRSPVLPPSKFPLRRFKEWVCEALAKRDRPINPHFIYSFFFLP